MPAEHAYIPYGRQSVDDADIEAVVAVLRSDWLTTGPAVDQFEQALAARVGVAHAVALNSGTAALHAAMYALEIGPGDEVIVPAMTFVATANAVIYQGATPVFADVDPDTLLIDPDAVAALIGPRTRAVIAVDYAGQPCDYDRLGALTRRHGLHLVSDACHALGATWNDRPCGALADITCFSFHPVKPITTGEGGMACTADAALAQRMRRLRNHGIDADFRQRAQSGTWRYDMIELGWNYRLSDIHAALGLSQLGRLDDMLGARRRIARAYDAVWSSSPHIRPLVTDARARHGHHLYVVRVTARDSVHQDMRQAGIGVNVHYIPVYLHPYYRERFGTRPGLCPQAEHAYGEILSLPIFPDLDREVQDCVIHALEEACGKRT